MMNFLSDIKINKCFFGHKWSRWTQQNVKMMYVKNGTPINYVETIQTRCCLNCNKMQKETL